MEEEKSQLHDESAQGGESPRGETKGSIAQLMLDKKVLEKAKKDIKTVK